MKTKLDNHIIDYKLASKFDIKHLKDHIALPFKESELYTKVAYYKELDSDIFAKQIHKPIKALYFTKNEILQHLSHFDVKLKLYNISIDSLKDQDSKIDMFLDILIKIALDLNSSDIHVESCNDGVTIRFRIDGIIKHFIKLPKDFINILSSFIKLKSNLDISLKRIPQDSRFSLFLDEEKYDFRVSTMPTIEGESIVLRILKSNPLDIKLANLGFNQNSLQTIKKNIENTNGLILITGPTGSGKTTTLYSIIKELNNTNKKIITVEDPVEYKIPKVQQISINNKIGLTFSKVLSNILRQDPDIILIGEIRDEESLKIALQASLTGHLVFATLHTNSAINTINRILDLQSEAFLIANTLKSIISQRLIRRLCDCKTFDEKSNTYKPQGCEKCAYEGYKGRLILYEILDIDEKTSTMIAKGSTTDEILKYAKEFGYKDIKDHAKDILDNGLSSIEEIYKVVKL